MAPASEGMRKHTTGGRIETEEMGGGFRRDVWGPTDRQNVRPPPLLCLLHLPRPRRRRLFPSFDLPGPIPISAQIRDAANSPPRRRRLPSLFAFLILFFFVGSSPPAPSVLMASRTQPSICSSNYKYIYVRRVNTAISISFMSSLAVFIHFA